MGRASDKLAAVFRASTAQVSSGQKVAANNKSLVWLQQKVPLCRDILCSGRSQKQSPRKGESEFGALRPELTARGVSSVERPLGSSPAEFASPEEESRKTWW